MSDPRVYFAAERTLLAWVRTGLTVIGLGFVIARFGLFLALMTAASEAPVPESQAHWLSSVLGTAMVLLGSGAIFLGLHNHRAFVRTLPPADLPEQPLPWLSSALALSLAVAGLLLAIYLAFV